MIETVYIEYSLPMREQEISESTYAAHFESCQIAIERGCAHIQVLGNDKYLLHKLRNPGEFPREGSFEVYFRDELLYSKLSTGHWPNPTSLVKQIRKLKVGSSRDTRRKSRVEGKQANALASPVLAHDIFIRRTNTGLSVNTRALPSIKDKYCDSPKKTDKIYSTKDLINKRKMKVPKLRTIQKHKTTGVTRKIEQATQVFQQSIDCRQGESPYDIIANSLVNSPELRSPALRTKLKLTSSAKKFYPKNDLFSTKDELNLFSTDKEIQKEPTDKFPAIDFQAEQFQIITTEKQRNPHEDLQGLDRKFNNFMSSSPCQTDSPGVQTIGKVESEKKIEHIKESIIEIKKEVSNKKLQREEADQSSPVISEARNSSSNITSHIHKEENIKAPTTVPAKEPPEKLFSAREKEEKPSPPLDTTEQEDKKVKFHFPLDMLTKEDEETKDHNNTKEPAENKESTPKTPSEKVAKESTETPADPPKESIATILRMNTERAAVITEEDNMKPEEDMFLIDQSQQIEDVLSKREITNKYEISVSCEEITNKKITYRNTLDRECKFYLYSTSPHMVIKDNIVTIAAGKRFPFKLRFDPVDYVHTATYYLFIDMEEDPLEAIEIVVNYT